MVYLSFSFCLTSPIMILVISKSTCVPSNGIISFFFLKFCSSLWLYFCFSSHLVLACRGGDWKQEWRISRSSPQDPQILGALTVFPSGAKTHEAAPPSRGLGEIFADLVTYVNPKTSTQDLRSQISFITFQILQT